MNPMQIPGPIPAAVQADVKQHLQAALGLLLPYHLDLTATDRQRLGREGGLGPESIPFAQSARLVIEKFPNILPRSVSDADMATYGQRLDTVNVCQDLKSDTQAVYSILNNLDVASGSGLMKLARIVYRSGQDDGGRTPGVEPLVNTMAERYARTNDSEDDADNNPPPTT